MCLIEICCPPQSSITDTPDRYPSPAIIRLDAFKLFISHWDVNGSVCVCWLVVEMLPLKYFYKRNTKKQTTDGGVLASLAFLQLTDSVFAQLLICYIGDSG